MLIFFLVPVNGTPAFRNMLLKFSVFLHGSGVQKMPYAETTVATNSKRISIERWTNFQSQEEEKGLGGGGWDRWRRVRRVSEKGEQQDRKKEEQAEEEKSKREREGCRELQRQVKARSFAK